MRALQNKPLRRRRLDIHFSIPKDNPSDKDINQGTLVAFNLDPSVSNEDLRQIFGAYGEVKEIRETPHRRHHKFIEFFDARAAEAALKSLNRSDIAGKRIKLEPSRPGGARRSLMLQLNQDLELDESQSFRHQVGSPVTNSPPGDWLQFNSPVEHSLIKTIIKSPASSILSSTIGNHSPGLASILQPQGSNTVKGATVFQDLGSNHEEHIFTSTNSSHGAIYHSNSLPAPTFSQYHGTLSSFSPPTSNGSSMETLSGPQFLWGSSSLYSEHTKPSARPRLSVGHPFTSSGMGHAFPLSGQNSLFADESQHHHHHHVGSAPLGIPFERHFGFLPGSPDTSFMNHVGYRGIGSGHNDGNFMANVGGSVNAGITIPRNITGNGSSNFRMRSSPRLSPVFLSKGPYPGLLRTAVEGLTDRGRSRRVDNNGSQVDSKKQFQLDLDKIKSGEDTRTTLMIKNIPNKYTSKMLLASIDENHSGTYDFLYLPIDFKNKCNVGYAFINILSPFLIIPFYETFNGKKWEKFNSEKVASLAYARIQGKASLVSHFRNSSLMNEDNRCRPILFHSEGPEPGDQIIQECLPSNNLNALRPSESDSSNSSGSPSKYSHPMNLKTS